MNETLRSNSDHLSSENASLASQVESMVRRIESLAEELAKPEDVRLREVLDALDGRGGIFDGLGARVGHLLDEMDMWIERAGAAERRLKKAEEVVTKALRTMRELEAAFDLDAADEIGDHGDRDLFDGMQRDWGDHMTDRNYTLADLRAAEILGLRRGFEIAVKHVRMAAWTVGTGTAITVNVDPVWDKAQEARTAAIAELEKEEGEDE